MQDEHGMRSGGGGGGSLRLLALAPDAHYPPTNGLRMRMSAMFEALRDEGHRLVLIAAGAPAGEAAPACEVTEYVTRPAAPLSSPRAWGGRARAALGGRAYTIERWRNRSWQRRIEFWLRSGRFDAIWCESPYPAINLPWPPPLPLIVNTHNLEYRLWQRYCGREPRRWRRAYASLEAWALRRWELEVYRRAAMVLTCSRQEAKLLRSQLPAGAQIVVAPNVVAPPASPPAGLERPWVVYTGGMDWWPNRDAVEFFGGQIWPRVHAALPEAEWIIAGREGPRRWQRRWQRLPGVRFTGAQASLAPWLSVAAAAVVPLRIGAGTRFKILEAAAWSRAIVSTRVGAEGLAFRPGLELELADRAEDFAAALLALMRNPARRRELGNAARRRLESDYSPANLRQAVAVGLAAGFGDKICQRGAHGAVLPAGCGHAIGA